MFSKSIIFKLLICLVLIVLGISFAFGTIVLADGGGNPPLPPDKSPTPGGDVNGNLLTVALLTLIQIII